MVDMLNYNRSTVATKWVCTDWQWIDSLESGQMPFVVGFGDGKLGEARNPAVLCEMIFGFSFREAGLAPGGYSMWLNWGLSRIGYEYASIGERIKVYDRNGLIYDNVFDQSDEESFSIKGLGFSNFHEPHIIDAYDPWTAIASLVRIGYITLYEKIPLFTDEAKIPGCWNCTFFGTVGKLATNGTTAAVHATERSKGTGDAGNRLVWCHGWDLDCGSLQKDWDGDCYWLTNGRPYGKYKQVLEKDLFDSYPYKKDWVPVENRK